MGFEGMLKSIRKVGFEPHSTVLEKWGLSICSTVIESLTVIGKWGLSISSTVLEKWGLSLSSNQN